MAYRNNSSEPVVCLGSKVSISDGKFEQGLRKFRNKVRDSGLLLELRDREGYEKPTYRRKKALAQAKKRWLRKLEAETIPKRMY